MSAHISIKLPDDVLKKYIGQYDFDKKHHVYITFENGSLEMEAPQGGLPKSPFFAEDEINFYLEVINARIEFLKDDSGNITGLIAHYNGKDEFAKGEIDAYSTMYLYIYCHGSGGAIDMRNSMPALVLMIGADVEMYGMMRC